MRIFIAGLATETNTFSPFVTSLSQFQQGTWFRNDASRHPPVLGSEPLIAWRQRSEADGHEVIESLCAYAEAGGVTTRDAYEEMRGMILGDLRAAGPVDVVLMFMHGAMIADGYDDCEGDMLMRVREVVGAGVTIGVELDLHCHLTEDMRSYADLLIAFKEYPHVDIVDRAQELYDIAIAAALGQVRPVMAYHDCRMINLWPTTAEPIKSFIGRMQALEGQDGILSVSFGHGYPWGDVADCGAKILVVTDGDGAHAANLAQRLGEEVWAMREATSMAYDVLDDKLDAAMVKAVRGSPLVLADVADNAGGGAASDNTAILRRLLDLGIEGTAIGSFWDPMAVAFCFDAGVGARFMLRIGGKCGAASDSPLDLLVTVRGLVQDYRSPRLSGSISSYGDTAWVEAAGVDIVLNSKRNQVYAPDLFTGLGMTISDKRVIVVKSTQHFYAAFAPIAAEVRYVSASGALTPDFGRIPYVKKVRPYWPKVADPFDMDHGS